MFAQFEFPELQRLRKRPFSYSSDWCGSETPRPPKRQQQLPPSPSTLGHSPDRVSRPSHPQDLPLTPPEPSRFSEKREFDDNNPAPNSPNKRRIEEWLRSTRSRRKSCPPRLELKVPDSDKGQPTLTRKGSCPLPPETSNPDRGNGLRRLIELLQDMSQSQQQSQKQSLRASSIASSRNARSITSHPDYQSVLRNNCIHINHIREKIPPELREFLNSSIIKQRSEPLTPGAITEAVQTTIEIRVRVRVQGLQTHIQQVSLKHYGATRPRYQDFLKAAVSQALVVPKAPRRCARVVDVLVVARPVRHSYPMLPISCQKLSGTIIISVKLGCVSETVSDCGVRFTGTHSSR